MNYCNENNNEVYGLCPVGFQSYLRHPDALRRWRGMVAKENDKASGVCDERHTEDPERRSIFVQRSLNADVSNRYRGLDPQSA